MENLREFSLFLKPVQGKYGFDKNSVVKRELTAGKKMKQREKIRIF